jgi:cytochrome c553
MYKPYSLKRLVTVIGSTWLVSGLAVAGQVPKQMLETIETRLQDRHAMLESIEAGRERATLCRVCHGADGNSVKPDVPNLASQNAGYLLEQFSKFADGTRKDFVMNQLADFTPQDQINLAIFYYSMPVKPQEIDPKLAGKGFTLFNAVCSQCHGDKGLGSQSLARLAGQQVEYVRNTLRYFRDTARNPALRKESRRVSEVMEGVAKELSDAQIDALAAYAAQLAGHY